MKLHLPKLLRVAVLTAMTFTLAAPAVAESINLSTVQVSNNTYTHTEESLTLGTDERMGLKDGDTWKKISDKVKNKQNYTGVFTPNVVVEKELKLTSNARVDVGGVGTTSSKYTGITADTISVQDTAELYTYKVNVRELNVSGGTVQIHYEENGTAATWGPYGDSGTNAASNKQAHIKEELTVSGGTVNIGSSQSDENMWSGTKHIQTVFGQGSTTGGATITQTGGTLDIQGKTAAVGNFSIEQSGGTMNVVTKTTKVTSNLANGPRLLLASNSTNTIRQSGTAEGMTMSIGRIQAYSSSGKVSLHIQQESQSGTISLLKGVSFGSGSSKSSITLTGGGSVSLTGDYSGAVFDVSLMKGKLSLADSSTKLKSSVMAVASGATLANAGIIQVGTGTAGTTKSGGLYVTSGGTFGVIANSSNQTTSVFTVGASGSNVTEWTMASGSTFGIGMTDAWVDSCYTGTMTQDTESVSFDFDVLVATGLADTTGLANTFDIIDMDEAHWSLGSAKWAQDGNETAVEGTLIYNPWIQVKNGGTVSEAFSDTTATLLTGLDISTQDVTLTGDNKHSLGTKINGVKVTLGHANALGTGAVTTAGTSTIKTATGVTAVLPGTISNSGTLTLDGSFSATGWTGTKVDEAYVGGNVAGNGFARDEYMEYTVVERKVDAASLTVQEGTTIEVNGEDYLVNTDGKTYILPDYATYYILTTDADESAVAIRNAGTDTTTVDMTAGKLTVDADMEVKATGGTIAVAADKTVSGSIMNATVSGTTGTEASGIVTATLEGANTLTGNLTVGGADVLNGATVTTTGETSLSTADGVTATLTKAITNEGTLTLSGSYDVSGLDDVPLPNNFIDVYGVEGTTGFAQYDRFEVEMVKKGADNASLVLDDADVEYTKKARAAVGTLEGELGTDGVATFVGGTDYSTYVIDNPNHQVSVSQIQDASNDQTTTVEMSAGSLTADEDIEVQTIGGNLTVINDNDGDTTDGGAVVSGSIKDTTVSALGGTITATIEGGELTTTGDALVNGTVTDTEITADGGEISGAISGGTLDVSSDALVSGTVTDAAITAEGGEITGDIAGGTLATTGDALVRGSVTDAAITAEGGEIAGDITGGTLNVSGDALVSGAVTDAAISTMGGEISGTIGGASSLAAMAGMTTLSGANNSYSGGTVVKDGATLVVTENGGLGTGGVTVESGATLDMQTDGNAQIEGNLVVNENGTITLNDGSLLEVNGSVTLNSGATIVLNGEYDVNAPLVSATGTLTMDDVTLVYNGTTVELEMQNGQVVLVSKFKQNKADATTLSNWGIATASRAFVNTVRGQRSNTGCIANGKGTAWVSLLGGNHDINGSDISLSGAALGADMKVGRNSRVGIALGYVEGEVRPSGLRQVDQEGSYIAAYGEHGLKKLSSTSCLSMDWVAAYGVTDSEGAGQKWEQDSVQLNSRVNWNKKVNNKLCMSVFGGLEYFANDSATVDGVKTGSIQNLRGEIGVAARYVAWGTPAVTDGKSGLVLAKGCEKLVLNGEVRYMNDMVRSNPVVRMNGLSGMGENPGRQGIGIEAGATYRIGERWSASANYGFNTMEDSKEHRVNVGAAYTF